MKRKEKLKLSWGLLMKAGRGSVKTGTRLSIRQYLRQVTGGDTFWAGMSLKLQKRYDLSRVGETIVGGDGAELG